MNPIAVDGKFGKGSKTALQSYLIANDYRIAADGIFGKGSVTALQQHIGANVDGGWGSNTTICLQQFLNKKMNDVNITVDGKRGPATYRALQKFLNQHQQNNENEYECDEKDEKEQYSKFKKDTKVYTKSCKEIEIDVNVKEIAKLVANSIKVSAGGAALIGNIAEQIQDTVIHCSWSSVKKNERIIKHFYEENVYIYLEIDRRISKQSSGIMVFGDKNVEIEVKTKYIYVEAGNDLARQYLQNVTRNQVHDSFNHVLKNIDKWNK